MSKQNPVDPDLIDDVNPLPKGTLDQLIYAVGTARGGTSMVQNLLGLHPQVLTFEGPSHFLNWVWKHRNKVQEGFLLQVLQLFSGFDLQAARDRLGEDKGGRLHVYVQQALRKKDMRELWQLYPLVWALIGDHGKDVSRLRCWLDKENDAYLIGDVAKAFPEARFICIARDPRAAVASIARRATYSLTGSFDSPLDTRRFLESCLYWRRTMQRLLRFERRHPDRTAWVRHEDLVRDTVDTVNRLFGHMGVDRLEADEVRALQRKLPYAASNDPDDTGKGVHEKPLTRWKTTLTAEQADIVAELTGPTARSLGYDVPAPEHRRGVLRLASMIDDIERRLVFLFRATQAALGGLVT